MLSAINPEEIEAIEEEYRKKMEKLPPLSQNALKVERDTKIAEVIGRQRREAIAAGGELGARVQAENDAALLELAMRPVNEETSAGYMIVPFALKVKFSPERGILAANGLPAAHALLEGQFDCKVIKKDLLLEKKGLNADDPADIEKFKTQLVEDIQFNWNLTKKELAAANDVLLALERVCSEESISKITTKAERDAVTEKLTIQSQILMSLYQLFVADYSATTTTVELTRFTIVAEADIPESEKNVDILPLISSKLPNGIKWICSCGSVNSLRFCPECGSPRNTARWICSCGKTNTSNFCSDCGTKRPQG